MRNTLSRRLRIVLSALLLVCCALSEQNPSQVSSEKLPTGATMVFKGTAQGGGLNFWIKGTTVELSSRPGEDPRQIAAHAAETINARQQLKEEGISAEAQGPELKIHVSEFWVFVCPSDKGLIVPPPPYDLRVEKASDGLVQLSWKNPPGGYDRIHILRGTLDVADGIDGTNTTFSEYANEDKLSYHVFGIKNAMPSCAAITSGS